MSNSASVTPGHLLGSPSALALFATLMAAALAATPLWAAEGWTIALFRPAYALTPAALLLFHRRYWLAIVVIASALAAGYTLVTAGTALVLIITAVADPLAATLIAVLVRWLDRGAFDLAEPRSVITTSVIFAGVPALFALLFSVALIAIAGITRSWQLLAFELWSSASVALLLVVPFVLAWQRASTPITRKSAGSIVWFCALGLPAAIVLLVAMAGRAHSVAFAGLFLVLVLLLWGAFAQQPRLMTSALLLTGSLAAWCIGALAGGEWGQVTLPVALICAAIVILLIGAALLGNARERLLDHDLLDRAGRLSARFATQNETELDDSLNDLFQETASSLGASSVALYARGAESALFRRTHGWSGAAAELPDALLVRQLRGANLPDSHMPAWTLECNSPPGPSTTPDTARNIGVTLLDTDKCESLLAANWTNTGDGSRRHAAALLGLLLPVCRLATKQVRSLIARQQADQRHEAVMAAVPDAICLIRKNGTFIDVNTAFSTLTGYSRNETLGRSNRDLKLFDLPVENVVLANTRDDAAPVAGLQAALRNKAGTTVNCRLFVAPIGTDGENQLLVIARDTQDNKRHQYDLEKQLNQAQRMEAIGQLTQGVAHDFNNILGSILGYTSLARMHRPSREDAKLQDYLAEIAVAGKRATLLIQQMLTFSRRGRTNPAPVNANKVLARVLEVLPSLLPAGIEPRLNVSQSLPPLVADSAQFEQAIISLAVNARDAITGSGTITLGSRRFRRREAVCASCRKTVSGEAIEIYVADSGSGIAPEVMDRLFEPFFTTKEVGRGTGLGLSGVHGFVHNHNGHMLISSAVGAGSEFCLVLPVESGEDSLPAPLPSPQKPATDRKQRILFVDDQESLASLMKQVLESRNFAVSTFTDSTAAWRNFEADATRYDAVVTDQAMPGLDGMELARLITELRPGIPVVMCTGMAANVTETELAAAGIIRVFRKPLRVMDFSRDLEQLLLEPDD